jgi:hypothetical protein
MLYQQMMRRYQGIEDAGAVFAMARRVLLDPENTNEEGTKSTNPETGHNNIEATEVSLSGKKEDELEVMDRQ